MASLRASALAATSLFFAVGCHLLGGIDGYVEGSRVDDDGGSGATGGAPGTGGAATTSTGGSGATTSAGGMAPTCDAESCKAANECQTCTCVSPAVCDCDDVDTGTLCAGGYCFNGDCVACIDNANFPCGSTQETCDSYLCVSAACDDGVKNDLETDVDCGGPDCAPCGAGQMCSGPADCASGYCPGSVCQNCTLQEHCASNQYCDGATCQGKKGTFSACSAGYECFSGDCACLGPFCGCT